MPPMAVMVTNQPPNNGENPQPQQNSFENANSVKPNLMERPTRDSFDQPTHVQPLSHIEVSADSHDRFTSIRQNFPDLFKVFELANEALLARLLNRNKNDGDANPFKAFLNAAKNVQSKNFDNTFVDEPVSQAPQPQDVFSMCDIFQIYCLYVQLTEELRTMLLGVTDENELDFLRQALAMEVIRYSIFQKKYESDQVLSSMLYHSVMSLMDELKNVSENDKFNVCYEYFYKHLPCLPPGTLIAFFPVEYATRYNSELKEQLKKKRQKKSRRNC